MLGDFDGDGVLDLVGRPDAAGPMTVFWGAGDGTFPARQVIESASSELWPARAGNLDEDGLLDLASIGADRSTVTVRRASGNRLAPFGEPTDYATGSGLSGLVLADFDADGRLDLVVGGSAGLEYWRGRDGARFEHRTTLASPDMLHGPGMPMATDWNGDGAPDLVYTDGGIAGSVMLGVHTQLYFRLGHGDGSFESEVACPLLLGAIGDLDHDHRPDLISGASLGATLLLGIDGCHASKVVALSDWPKQGGIALADLSGDGNLDVLADQEKNLMVRVGDGRGGFGQSLSLSTYAAAPPVNGTFLTGDLNRDGKLDIVWARVGKWGVLLNTCQ